MQVNVIGPRYIQGSKLDFSQHRGGILLQVILYLVEGRPKDRKKYRQRPVMVSWFAVHISES